MRTGELLLVGRSVIKGRKYFPSVFKFSFKNAACFCVGG